MSSATVRSATNAAPARTYGFGGAPTTGSRQDSRKATVFGRKKTKLRIDCERVRQDLVARGAQEPRDLGEAERRRQQRQQAQLRIRELRKSVRLWHHKSVNGPPRGRKDVGTSLVPRARTSEDMVPARLR